MVYCVCKRDVLGSGLRVHVQAFMFYDTDFFFSLPEQNTVWPYAAL